MVSERECRESRSGIDRLDVKTPAIATDRVLGAVALANYWPNEDTTTADSSPALTMLGLLWVRKDAVGRGIAMALTRHSRAISAERRFGYSSKRNMRTYRFSAHNTLVSSSKHDIQLRNQGRLQNPT